MTSRARSALLTGSALAPAVLFTLYLRQSRSVAVGSDGGSIALQGWDILHGNILLHGWAMSDVSFYPTELPQYALLEWLHGLSPDVVQVRQVSIRSGRLTPPNGGWGYARAWYQPPSQHADFVVTSAAPGTAAWHTLLNSASNTFGFPARTYSYRQYTVLVWGGNLLRRLGWAGREHVRMLLSGGDGT